MITVKHRQKAMALIWSRTGNLSDSFPVTENGGNGTADICELHGVPVLFLKTVAVDTTILSFYK